MTTIRPFGLLTNAAIAAVGLALSLGSAQLTRGEVHGALVAPVIMLCGAPFAVRAVDVFAAPRRAVHDLDRLAVAAAVFGALGAVSLCLLGYIGALAALACGAAAAVLSGFSFTHITRRHANSLRVAAASIVVAVSPVLVAVNYEDRFAIAALIVGVGTICIVALVRIRIRSLSSTDQR